MRLSQQDLLQAFPSGALIRAVADGKVALPSDRVERAIYQNQVFAYEEKRQKQAQEGAQQPGQNLLLPRVQMPFSRKAARRRPRPRPAKA